MSVWQLGNVTMLEISEGDKRASMPSSVPTSKILICGKFDNTM
jgi:hypothetical protein